MKLVSLTKPSISRDLSHYSSLLVVVRNSVLAPFVRITYGIKSTRLSLMIVACASLFYSTLHMGRLLVLLLGLPLTPLILTNQGQRPELRCSTPASARLCSTSTLSSSLS